MSNARQLCWLPTTAAASCGDASRNGLRQAICVLSSWCLLAGLAAAQPTESTESAAPATASAADVEFFEQQVRPILAEKCLKCHGPEKQRGGLRLDHRSFVLEGGDLGPAVSLEVPTDSQLLRAIRYEDLEMPPDGRLPDEQIDILERWVQRGVAWPEGETPAPAAAHAATPPEVTQPHWAYQPLSVSSLPEVQGADWGRNPIDRFVLSKLEANGLSPNAPATSRVLLRRLYYDLLGLPPAATALASLAQQATSLDYERHVDELLARPELGEHWGRHWLDLVRYAETNGYERDGPKDNAWRYRDYVIRAFNSDKPYDRFVREQLAGDELADRDYDALIATGYYRLGLWDDEPADADQAYYDSLDDVVATTGMVFLGTTMGCARCHDHKIDPIPQRDYYRMLAFFHNIQKDIRDLGTKRSAFTLNTQTELGTDQERAAYEQRLQSHRTLLAACQQRVDDCEAQVVATFSNPEKEDAVDDNVRRQLIGKRAQDVLGAEQFAEYVQAKRDLRRLKQQAVGPLPQALTVRENGREPPATFVLIRGSAHAPGEQVVPGFPAAFSTQEPQFATPPVEVNSSGRRTAFADWVVDRQNPLTARVIVNRVWQHHFGRGLVRTTSDFGRYGEMPTHPELLDYLAAELMRHDWQLKWLHRLILTSQTYRMSSADQNAGLTADPENHLLWRFDMRRLTAEELRDTVLSVTGQLNRQMGGPSIYSKIPDEIRQSASRPDAAWGNSSLADQVRRSVYVFVKRSVADPVLLGFDAADTDGSCPVRFATTVPTQALTTLNGQFFNEQAAVLAEHVRQTVGSQPDSFVAQALTLAMSRAPHADEIQRGVELLRAWQQQDGVTTVEAETYFCLLALNLNELIYID